MASVTRFLTKVLRLKVNDAKSSVCRARDLEYLGFTFRGRKIRWSDKSFSQFKARLRGFTSRSWNVSMSERLQRMNRYLRGWMNYFGVSQYYRVIPELDGWLRRRIRMCYWKQWRRPSTRIRRLLALGTCKRDCDLDGCQP